MNTTTAADFQSKSCKPCEGGVSPVGEQEAKDALSKIAGWQLVGEGQRIRRSWTLASFKEGIDFINRIADVAEAEQHHPDLHLTDYKQFAVELSTHAIGGLSENDFILAAKINNLPS